MTLSALHGIKITLIKKHPVRVLNIVPKIVRILIKNLSQKRQKLAPFRRFDGTLLSYVRQVRAFARTRQEPQKSI